MLALEIRQGNYFYVGEPYPNPVHWDKFFPTHYDPLADAHAEFKTYQVMKYYDSIYLNIDTDLKEQQ